MQVYKNDKESVWIAECVVVFRGMCIILTKYIQSVNKAMLIFMNAINEQTSIPQEPRISKARPARAGTSELESLQKKIEDSKSTSWKTVPHI